VPLNEEAQVEEAVKLGYAVAPKPVVWDKARFEGLLRLGEFAKALALVRHMRKRWPNNPSIAHALVLLESHVEGRRELSCANLLFEEACRAFLQGEKEVARRMFLTCYQMQPKAWLMRFNLSRLGIAQNRELCDAELLKVA